MSASHRSSKENFENSTPELDMLVDIALAQRGVLGARLTGGGFGGAIVALVEKDPLPAIASTIETEYTRRTGHHGAAIPCQIAAGAIPPEACNR